MKISRLGNKFIEKILVILLIALGGKTSAQVQSSCRYGTQRPRPCHVPRPIQNPTPIHAKRINHNNQTYLYDLYLVVNGKVKSKNYKDPLDSIEITIRLKRGRGIVYYEKTIYTNERGKFKFIPEDFYVNSICELKIKDLKGFYSSKRKEFKISKEFFSSGCATFFRENFLLDEIIH